MTELRPVEEAEISPPTFLFLKGRSGRNFSEGKEIDYYYIRGKVGAYSFRIKIENWICLGTFEFKSVEFRFVKEYSLPFRYYFNLFDKRETGRVIEFLKKTIPDSPNATLLVMVMLRKAGERNYFSYIDETPLFPPGKERDDGDVFTNERFISIKKWLIVYFALGLGFSFPILEVALKQIGALFVRVKMEE